MDYNVKKEKERYTVEMTFTADEVSTAEDAAYKRDAAKYNVEGFRKGKAPKSMIEKSYGEDIFHRAAVDDLFNKAYPQVLREHPEIKPIDSPHASVKTGKDGTLGITVIVDVEPEFTLGKYTGLEIKQAKVKVTDKDVDQYLERVVQGRARQLAAGKDHKIKNGDIAVIDFVGSVDGVEFEGGKADNHELEIGSRSFIDTFEEQLVGAKIGDKVDVNVTFPKEYHAENLAGAKALFKVEIRNILIKELPAIDDELAKEASEFETLADFKKDIMARLEKQAAVDCARENENNLLQTVATATKINIPEKMIDRRHQHMMYDIEHRLSHQGLNLEMFAMYQGMTVEQFTAQQREQAKLAVQSQLVFDAIIEKEKITITKQEVDAELKRIAEANNKKVSDYTDEQLAYLEHDLLFGKLIKLLTEKNKFV